MNPMTTSTLNVPHPATLISSLALVDILENAQPAEVTGQIDHGSRTFSRIVVLFKRYHLVCSNGRCDPRHRGALRDALGTLITSSRAARWDLRRRRWWGYLAILLAFSVQRPTSNAQRRRCLYTYALLTYATFTGQ